ncbi:MAG: zinc ribbon domain-containing protein [Candidatus Brockarchaeota archaeon]|nr:zinc ribbon domain-containing protein [Candidatus Brockarchaeota archaeon]
MTYNYLTTGELVDELESYSAQVTALSLQIEKLFKLRTEGKISDVIYAELYEDIAKKVESARSMRFELTEAANSRIKEITSEVSELKYRLERLEVRRMLDFISAEKYSAAKEELLKKMGESDEIALLIGKMLSTMEEVFKVIDEYLPSKPSGLKLAEPSAEKPQASPPPKAEPAPLPATPPPKAEPEPLLRESLCPRCRTENPSDAIFCFACGTRLASEQHVEQAQYNLQERAQREASPRVPEPEAKRKMEEAVPKQEAKKEEQNNFLIQKCPNCGRENLSLAGYCYNCNAALPKRSEQKPMIFGRP